MKVFREMIFILFIIYSSNAFSLESHVESKTKIISLLQKWSQDFNAKNIQAVCSLFAPNLIASYPGNPDRNYEEMCQHLKKALTNADKHFHYEMPEIEQIFVENDLAVVRLIWTLKIRHGNQQNLALVKEKGLDVFKRQEDGSWKIMISYAYPLVETVQAKN